MKKLKFYSGSKVPTPEVDMARQVVSTAANAFIPGAGLVIDGAAALSKKFGSSDCEVDPATGKEVCKDTSSIAGGSLKSILDPVGTIAKVGTNLIQGNLKGALAESPIGKILGVKDGSNDARLEEIRKQIQKKKEDEINKSNQTALNQGVLQRQNSFNSPSFGMNTFKTGGKLKSQKLKFEKGGVTDCGCNKDSDEIDTDILFDLPQQIIDKIHEVSGVSKGKKYDNSTKEKIKSSAKNSNKSLRDFITSIPDVEKHIIVIEKFQEGGLLDGAKKYLSGTEQKMYESALKTGNKKAIQFLESKIKKKLNNVKNEQDVKNERLAELASRKNGNELIDAYTNQNSWKSNIPFYNTLSGNNAKLIKSDFAEYENPRELETSGGRTAPIAGGYSEQELKDLDNPKLVKSTLAKIKKRSGDYKDKQLENIIGNLVEPITDAIDVATFGASTLLTRPAKQGLKQLAKNKGINAIKDIGNDISMISKEVISKKPETYNNIVKNLYDKYSGTSINSEQLQNKINADLKEKGFKDINVAVEKGNNSYTVYTKSPDSYGYIGLSPMLNEKDNFFTKRILPKIPEKYRPKPYIVDDAFLYEGNTGLRKRSDFPNLKNYKGAAPSIHNSINDFLKERNLGNLLSGGTGHTTEGLDRWNKLVNKGIAEQINPENSLKAKLYKLKKQGGLLQLKKGGYLKNKNTYITKDGKETKRGLWANVYLKNKKKYLLGGLSTLLSNPAVMQGVGSMLGGGGSGVASGLGALSGSAGAISAAGGAGGGIGNIVGQVAGMLPDLLNKNQQAPPVAKQLSYQEFVNQMLQEGKITQAQATDTTMQQQLQQLYNQYLQQNKGV